MNVEQLPMNDIKRYPIVIKNLHKRYHDKIAVVDTCLSIGNEVRNFNPVKILRKF